jgi:hypothetical protein
VYDDILYCPLPLFKLYGLIFAVLISPGVYAPCLLWPVLHGDDNRLVDNGSYAATKNGQDIFSHKTDEEYIPASICELATTLAALETLQKD